MSQRSRLRLVILQVLILSLLLTLFGRLWFLQVRDGEKYVRAASSNQIREVVTPAVRGQILDDQGRPLVDNRTGLVVSVDRTALSRRKDKGVPILKRLAQVLNVPYQDVANQLRLCTKGVSKPCWNGSPYQPIPVTDKVTTQQALQIMERHEDFPGVTAQPEAIRNYPAPEGANAAHLLGYLSPVTDAELQSRENTDAGQLQQTDMVGRSGLEQTYDDQLRGRAGVTRLTVDNLGRVIGTAGETSPVPGNNLVTSIDAKVQAVAEQQLAAAIDRAHGQFDKTTSKNYQANTGAVVVMDVRTGRLVALASYPTYDPSVWVGGISQRDYQALTNPANGTPLLARAIQGQYAPGSTFKLISTAAAGMDGFSLNSGSYPCTSSFQIGNRSFGNFESESFGDISMTRALQVSCDTVFYKIAYQMWLADGGDKAGANPREPIETMARAFNLGKRLGIDIPGEAPGSIDDWGSKRATWQRNKATWCKFAKDGYPVGTAPGQAPDQATARYWQALATENCADGNKFRAGDAAIEAIGQGGVTVTPLQLAEAYAAIANGGTLYQPQLGKAVLSPDGKLVKEFPPKVIGKLPVSSSVISFLHSALGSVTTAGTAAPAFADFPLGKVSVATKTGTAEVQGQQSTSVFASFAPVDNPQYAIVMMVPQGGTGVGTSGPSVAAIYKAIYGANGTDINQNAALPNGAPPANLPRIKSDGTVVVPAAFTLALPNPAPTPLTGRQPAADLPAAPYRPADAHRPLDQPAFGPAVAATNAVGRPPATVVLAAPRAPPAGADTTDRQAEGEGEATA
jgi:penicillin-binding protein 2